MSPAVSIATVVLALTLYATPRVPAQRAPDGVPQPAIDAVIAAFSSHDIVALDEGAHGNVAGHQFRVALAQDPRFAMVVNDIVVEFGNARYQDVADQFLRGEEIDDTSLRHIWEDTTQAHAVWDVPIYEEFFRAVRRANASLPDGRKLRVLLADPPIDWGAVKKPEDAEVWGSQRDTYPADVIRREVLAKHRRALLIFGAYHIFRIPLGESVVHLLETTSAAKVFSIGTPISAPSAPDLRDVQTTTASWPVPSLTVLAGTLLGLKELMFYYPPPLVLREGRGIPEVPTQWRGLRLQDQVDALLYLGLPASMRMSRLAPEKCGDPSYVNMRLSRMGLNTNSNPLLDAFKRFCGIASKH
jgi:hypothetical protein